MVSFPQSHRHFHRCMPPHFPAYSVTVSCPNRLPMKSFLGGWLRHPQLLHSPEIICPSSTLVSLPQSHLQSHTTLPWLPLSSVGQIAVSLPKRMPVISLCPGRTAIVHPQSRTDPRFRQRVSSKISPPQSQRQRQTIYPAFLCCVGSSTVNRPTLSPTRITSLASLFLICFYDTTHIVFSQLELCFILNSSPYDVKMKRKKRNLFLMKGGYHET